MKEKPKVAFICVHNSCRSQIAEALGKRLACDVFELQKHLGNIWPLIFLKVTLPVQKLYRKSIRKRFG